MNAIFFLLRTKKAEWISPAIVKIHSIASFVLYRYPKVSGIASFVLNRHSKVKSIATFVLYRHSEVSGIATFVLNRHTKVSGITSTIFHRHPEVCRRRTFILHRYSKVQWIFIISHILMNLKVSINKRYSSYHIPIIATCIRERPPYLTINTATIQACHKRSMVWV